MKIKIIVFLSFSISLFLISCKKDVVPSDKEVLINKWHYELMGDDYHCFSILVRAAMIDPATYEIDSLVVKNSDNLLFAISHVLKRKVVHIQSIRLFSDMPGRNPWGKTDKPVYRKSLPSEMKAMENLVGKYAGDCSSISCLSTALCRIHGISEDDIFIIRTRQHSAGLIQYKSNLYMFNNTWVEKLSANELFFLNLRYKITGFYNDKYYCKKSVWLTKKGLLGPGTLKDKLKKNYGINFNDINVKYTSGYIETLTRIALQEKSTDMMSVIKASERGPLFKQLCAENSTIIEIIKWINNNVESKQLFSYTAFLTPDQVIVFKTAYYFDKTIFLWSYCNYKHIPCEVFKNNGAYCIIINHKLFYIKDKIVESDTIIGNSIPPTYRPLTLETAFF
jgi:hypothetical protein